MAAYFESFGLRELAAAPEDAFRLASLAMAEGQRIPGYGGDYFRMYLGDARSSSAPPGRTARTSCWAWTPTRRGTASGTASWRRT